MPCNLATVQTAACASGMGKLTNPVQLLQVIAQNLATTLGDVNPALSTDVNAILARACESGIGKQTDELSLMRIYAQNLCGQIT